MSYISPAVNEYFRQVIPVFDTGTPGGDGTIALQTSVANVQSMVNFENKTVSTDFLQSYTADGTITVNSPVIFAAGTTGINLTANNYFSTGSVVVNNVYASTSVYANYGDFDRTSTGQLYVSSYGIFGSTVTALDFLQPSDRRKKINVAPLQGAYSTLEELQGVSFEWKDTFRKDVGFLAQDVEAVIPGAVTVDGNGDYHMSYQKMIPYLVESVKELGERVSTLEGLLRAK
jgi:hypothetical protein